MELENILSRQTAPVVCEQDVPVSSLRYMKTVTAFANGSGGTLFFGVDEQRQEVTGFAEDEVLSKANILAQAIYDGCEPKIVPDIAFQRIEDKTLIIVRIRPGMQTPYYVKFLGPEEGTFIRTAGSIRQAEPHQRQDLALRGTNNSFDQIRSRRPVSEQDISAFCRSLYEYACSLAQTEEERSGLRPLNKSQLLSWQLLVEGKRQFFPTNGYFLLNPKVKDFPESAIQCAVFQGMRQNVFIMRKSFTGAIYDQIDQAWQFMVPYLQAKVSPTGKGDGHYGFSLEAIREAIAYGVCQRSYLMPGRVQITLYDDRLELAIPGMISRDISAEDLKGGLCQVQNPTLFRAFSYMGILHIGQSSLQRLFQEAQEKGLPEPELVIVENNLKVILYGTSKDENINNDSLLNNDDTKNINNDTKKDTDDTKEKILYFMQEKPQITLVMLQNKLGVSLITIKRAVAELQQQGKLKRKGSHRNGSWVVIL